MSYYSHLIFGGVIFTVQDLLRQDARIQDLYFNISEMKLSITSLYIISDAPKYDIIWTENSDVIDSFISEILKYKSWILASLHNRSWTERFTPLLRDYYVISSKYPIFNKIVCIEASIHIYIVYISLIQIEYTAIFHTK